MIKDKLLYTVPEASARVSVSDDFLRAEHKEHRIRFLDISRGRGQRPVYRVEASELERWANDLPTAIPKQAS
ncbi:hypothetical protein [Gordonia sp. (in: high G+C Gram-positive bacteria)]|uniref:hypothetical protein n=1 Tax=Gordonia sp. (in: high G+C Gram-positive bacteria) TaxID=84139 RepID=UPI003F9BE7A1